jgi:hypothetical protein
VKVGSLQIAIASSLLACGGGGESGTSRVAVPPTTTSKAPTSPALTLSPATRPAAPPATPPDAAALFAQLRPELASCYEAGKKTTPEMGDGKLTLNASFDASGRPLCVIPSDHTGLTQEVEDCMSARFAAQRLAGSPSVPWSASVPVVIRGGAVQLGERASNAVAIESVETFRMPDAFDVLESLEPELQASTRSLDRSSGVKGILVGARVGADGRAQCALATSRGSLPAAVAECAAGVLRGAKFPPPKRGAGLVLLPISFGAPAK